MPEGAEARGARDIEANGERRGAPGGEEEEEEDRSDAQVPRYTFSFHLPAARAIRDRGRKKKRVLALREGEESGKNFRPFPPMRGERLRIASGESRAEFATFATSRARERERERAMKTRMRARARASHSCDYHRATVCGIG